MIFSHDRQVNFSRTVWITFHCRGTTSRVSVMSSPSLTSLPPQQGQQLGAGTITRSHGRWAGSGARIGFLRLTRRTVVGLGAAGLAATSSSAALACSSSSCNSSWSSSLRPRSADYPNRSRFILAINSLR